MARALIVPDIHNATERAEAIISAHGTGCDRIILLGDYFDDFGDSAADAERVAKWLLQSVQDSRRVHLIGNHDLGYLGTEQTAEIYPCPGWSIDKYEAASAVLQGFDRRKLSAAVAFEGWLLSHAGFHRSHLEGRLMVQLLDVCDEAFAKALGGVFDPIFAPSRARGFGDYVGGLTWLDWSREFTAIDGWHQIVGHTPSRSVRAAYSTDLFTGHHRITQEPVPRELRDRTHYATMNWCLDTKLQCVGIIDGTEFEVVWL
jgi:hypothetical protein